MKPCCLLHHMQNFKKAKVDVFERLNEQYHGMQWETSCTSMFSKTGSEHRGRKHVACMLNLNPPPDRSEEENGRDETESTRHFQII